MNIQTSIKNKNTSLPFKLRLSKLQTLSGETLQRYIDLCYSPSPLTRAVFCGGDCIDFNYSNTNTNRDTNRDVDRDRDDSRICNDRSVSSGRSDNRTNAVTAVEVVNEISGKLRAVDLDRVGAVGFDEFCLVMREMRDMHGWCLRYLRNLDNDHNTNTNTHGGNNDNNDNDDDSDNYDTSSDKDKNPTFAQTIKQIYNDFTFNLNTSTSDPSLNGTGSLLKPKTKNNTQGTRGGRDFWQTKMKIVKVDVEMFVCVIRWWLSEAESYRTIHDTHASVSTYTYTSTPNNLRSITNTNTNTNVRPSFDKKYHSNKYTTGPPTPARIYRPVDEVRGLIVSNSNGNGNGNGNGGESGEGGGDRIDHFEMKHFNNNDLDLDVDGDDHSHSHSRTRSPSRSSPNRNGNGNRNRNGDIATPAVLKYTTNRDVDTPYTNNTNIDINELNVKIKMKNRIIQKTPQKHLQTLRSIARRSQSIHGMLCQLTKHSHTHSRESRSGSGSAPPKPKPPPSTQSQSPKKKMCTWEQLKLVLGKNNIPFRHEVREFEGFIGFVKDCFSLMSSSSDDDDDDGGMCDYERLLILASYYNDDNDYDMNTKHKYKYTSSSSYNNNNKNNNNIDIDNNKKQPKRTRMRINPTPKITYRLLQSLNDTWSKVSDYLITHTPNNHRHKHKHKYNGNVIDIDSDSGSDSEDVTFINFMKACRECGFVISEFDGMCLWRLICYEFGYGGDDDDEFEKITIPLTSLLETNIFNFHDNDTSNQDEQDGVNKIILDYPPYLNKQPTPNNSRRGRGRGNSGKEEESRLLISSKINNNVYSGIVNDFEKRHFDYDQGDDGDFKQHHQHHHLNASIGGCGNGNGNRDGDGGRVRVRMSDVLQGNPNPTAASAAGLDEDGERGRGYSVVDNTPFYLDGQRHEHKDYHKHSHKHGNYGGDHGSGSDDDRSRSRPARKPGPGAGSGAGVGGGSNSRALPAPAPFPLDTEIPYLIMEARESEDGRPDVLVRALWAAEGIRDDLRRRRSDRDRELRRSGNNYRNGNSNNNNRNDDDDDNDNNGEDDEEEEDPIYPLLPSSTYNRKSQLSRAEIQGTLQKLNVKVKNGDVERLLWYVRKLEVEGGLTRDLFYELLGGRGHGRVNVNSNDGNYGVNDGSVSVGGGGRGVRNHRNKSNPINGRISPFYEPGMPAPPPRTRTNQQQHTQTRTHQHTGTTTPSRRHTYNPEITSLKLKYGLTLESLRVLRRIITKANIIIRNCVTLDERGEGCVSVSRFKRALSGSGVVFECFFDEELVMYGLGVGVGIGESIPPPPPTQSPEEEVIRYTGIVRTLEEFIKVHTVVQDVPKLVSSANSNLHHNRNNRNRNHGDGDGDRKQQQQQQHEEEEENEEENGINQFPYLRISPPSPPSIKQRVNESSKEAQMKVGLTWDADVMDRPDHGHGHTNSHSHTQYRKGNGNGKRTRTRDGKFTDTDTDTNTDLNNVLKRRHEQLINTCTAITSNRLLLSKAFKHHDVRASGKLTVNQLKLLLGSSNFSSLLDVGTSTGTGNGNELNLNGFKGGRGGGGDVMALAVSLMSLPIIGSNNGSSNGSISGSGGKTKRNSIGFSELIRCVGGFLAVVQRDNDQGENNVNATEFHRHQHQLVSGVTTNTPGGAGAASAGADSRKITYDLHQHENSPYHNHRNNNNNNHSNSRNHNHKRNQDTPTPTRSSPGNYCGSIGGNGRINKEIERNVRKALRDSKTLSFDTTSNADGNSTNGKRNTNTNANTNKTVRIQIKHAITKYNQNNQNSQNSHHPSSSMLTRDSNDDVGCFEGSLNSILASLGVFIGGVEMGYLIGLICDADDDYDNGNESNHENYGGGYEDGGGNGAGGNGGKTLDLKQGRFLNCARICEVLEEIVYAR